MNDRKALFAVETAGSEDPDGPPFRVQFISLTVNDVEVRLQERSDIEALDEADQRSLVEARNVVRASLEGGVRQGSIPGRMPMPSRVAAYWKGDLSSMRIVIES